MYLHRRIRSFCVATAAAVTIVLALPGSVAAQRALPPDTPVRIAPLPAATTPFMHDDGVRTVLAIDTVRSRTSTGALIVAGVLTAGISAVAGAVIGYHIIPDRNPPTDDPGLDGTITGWIFAPALFTPAAVHIVNNSQGNIAVTYGAALALAIAGYTLGYAGTDVGTVLLVGAPVFQAVSAVVLERRTGQRRN
jgi:hypothetical protein